MTGPPASPASGASRTATPTAAAQLRDRLSPLLPADPRLRVLTVVTLVNTLGNGLFYTTAALFYTRSLGLTPNQVGLGLAVAGVCGIAAGPPLGALADRWGARRALVLLLATDGLGTLGYLVIHSFPAFLLLASVVAFVGRGASAVRNTLVGTALPPGQLVRGRAYLRAVTNVGIGAGAALAAAALQSDTREAYLTIIAADAATFLVAGLLLLRLPSDAPARTAQPPGAQSPGAQSPGAQPSRVQAGRRRAAASPLRRALTDVRYLVITVLNGVLAMQFGVMEIGIPLWVVRFTVAPRWVISATLVLNTVMVVLLQVRFSRGTDSPARAARTCGRAGLLLAAGCVLYGLAHGLPAPAAIVLLLAGGVAQTIGEMLSSAGGWALSYALADRTAQGAYQGVFNSGFTAGSQLSALVVTTTAIRFGSAGWLLLAAVFAAAGTAMVPAARWAQARLRQPAAGAPQESA